MMQNDLFRHGSGDPLSKGSPWKGIPHYSSLQSLNPAKTRAPQHQPYQSPSWRGGFSTDSRAPSPAHHHSSKALSGWSRSRKRTHTNALAPEGDTLRPWKPLLPFTYRCQNAPIPTNRVFNPPREPPSSTLRTRAIPTPTRGGGAPPGDSTPSPPQESSPTARRLLRLLVLVVVVVAAAVAGSLHSSSRPRRTIPGL